ncbi:2-isopropylmalate synthase [Phlyctema vagabunda]|uniref:2-isopropylmalate synthase n=1 Tax=Phlyctema vagabunda TaxID=108571 RepID=A0ABR4PCX5_9HELO
MTMLKDPSEKYAPFIPLSLPDRQWPNRRILKAPQWLSTDLRDGNQSLTNPMVRDLIDFQKTEYFHMLCRMGFKNIEVSFPIASQIEESFTRSLIETPGAIPDDVRIQAMTPCRPEAMRKTVDALKGAKKATVCTYLCTSKAFRDVMLGITEQESLEKIVEGVEYLRSITKDDPETTTEWSMEFGMEAFSDTDPEFAVRLGEALLQAWKPTIENPIIIGLGASVEMSTPNVFADQVEYFSRNISNRDKICISLHPHNDRGCAVAASELGYLAGGDRIEGCLFGNGERTGNVDLVTLGLNLYTQGIHPGIDFSDLKSIMETCESLTEIKVHPRAPYAGEMVFLAFSGAHQDAINKGMRIRKEKESETKLWKVPYLPMDPGDVGRSFEAHVIKVNSQSGKAGAAWIIRQKFGIDIPRELQVAFSKVVQAGAEEFGRQLSYQEVKDLFTSKYYLPHKTTLLCSDVEKLVETDGKISVSLLTSITGVEQIIEGTGINTVAAIAHGLSKNLGIEINATTVQGHTLQQDSGLTAKEVSFIRCHSSDVEEEYWGVGVESDLIQSQAVAVVTAAWNLLKERDLPLTRGGTNSPA